MRAGLSKELGPVAYGENEEEVFLGRSVARQQNMSEETARKVDSEIRKIVDKGYDRAREVLTEKIDDLHKLAKALLTYETLSGEEIENLINKIKFKKVNVMGSIGCKIASIIRGDNDIYVSLSLPSKSSPKDWDFAAPEAILRASGGSITNLDNENLTYGSQSFSQGGIIIASNSKQNHKEICLQIKEIIERYNIYPL